MLNAERRQVVGTSFHARISRILNRSLIFFMSLSTLRFIRQVAAPRLELAKDGGVYENEPAVRTDVVRSDEFEPDVIPAAQMRSTRAMWARKELEGDQTSNYKPPAREVGLLVVAACLNSRLQGRFWH